MSDDWITTAEAAQLTGYHPNHIRRLIRAGEVKARKWGSAFMISRESLLDYAQRMTTQGQKRGPKQQE